MPEPYSMTILNPDDLDLCRADWVDHSDQIVRAMQSRHAYPHDAANIEHHETHISHVFLAGDFAYKIKKPIRTDFLDYSTLEKRHHFCREEIRLDARYAGDLYIGVVPITADAGLWQVDGVGSPIEYAVKMRRFPNDALLSHRLDANLLSTSEISDLAATVADFHLSAASADQDWALKVPKDVRTNMVAILDSLSGKIQGEGPGTLNTIRTWSDEYFTEHSQEFVQRSMNGFIRECHGDLHTENIVRWKGKLVPFDGIEFNDAFRIIDISSDATFLAMDIAAREHLDLSRSFINRYLERTGDYGSLPVFRWYQVYRAVIRAMVAQMKSDQHPTEPEAIAAADAEVRHQLELAYRFTLAQEPTLTITHGLSGSGKTTVSELVVQRHGSVRLRSDVERKRLFGLPPGEPVDAETKAELYGESANQATYQRLKQLAGPILAAGYPVIIDATFLHRNDRDRFHRFAEASGVHFAILDCHTDAATLRQRVADRIAKGGDASDADADVLDKQLRTHEPLTDEERKYVVDIPDLVEVIQAVGSTRRLVLENGE